MFGIKLNSRVQKIIAAFLLIMLSVVVILLGVQIVSAVNDNYSIQIIDGKTQTVTSSSSSPSSPVTYSSKKTHPGNQ